MSKPIIFISHQRIKEGKKEGYIEYYRQVAEHARQNKPGTLSHIAYLDEDGGLVSVIHTFPDAKAMEDHMFGVDELARKARDYMEIVSMDIFGSPSEPVLNFIKQVAGSGVVVNFKPNWIGGYFRSITD